MKFAPAHSTRIRAIDSQFNFDDSDLTTALLGTENLYAIADCTDTTSSVSAGGQLSLVFQWDTSLGNFSSTTKNERIQIAFCFLANEDPVTQTGGTTNGSNGSGTIEGYNGGVFQLNKYSSTSDGRMTSLCGKDSSGYFGYFDGTLSSAKMSYEMYDAGSGSSNDIEVISHWYDDDGVTIRVQNNDASAKTVKMYGYAYGFC